MVLSGQQYGYTVVRDGNMLGNSRPGRIISRNFVTTALKFARILRNTSGSVSSVHIATWLRAGRSGIESRWGRGFPPVQTGPGTHPASCKMGTGSFPEVKCGRGVLLTTNPLLVPRLWKNRAIPLLTIWATPGL